MTSSPCCLCLGSKSRSTFSTTKTLFLQPQDPTNSKKRRKLAILVAFLSFKKKLKCRFVRSVVTSAAKIVFEKSEIFPDLSLTNKEIYYEAPFVTFAIALTSCAKCCLRKVTKFRRSLRTKKDWEMNFCRCSLSARICRC